MITRNQKWLMILCISVGLGSWSCGPKSKNQAAYLGVPSDQIEQQLNDLIDDWYPVSIDNVNGGYWTNFEYDWTRSEDQPKMLVTQARHLWTISSAIGTSSDYIELKPAARHGFDFLKEKMWNAEMGGFDQYWHVEEPSGFINFQQSYGNAFAIYALAAYADMSKDGNALTWLDKAVEWLDESAHDTEHGGYFNLISIDGLHVRELDTASELVKAHSWGQVGGKDQNSSIHLLEAFTMAYQVLPNALIKSRLEEMLLLVRDKMVHENGHLQLYFTHDWQPISHIDSSRQFIEDNLSLDHISFGHDIETAYLLVDASKALYGQTDSKTLRIAKNLVDHTLEWGFAPDYYGLYDKGYRFKGTADVEILDRRKVWWAQAEAWHALGLMASIFPEVEKYQLAFKNMWQYIVTESIDHVHGGWYNYGLDISPDNAKDRKGHIWKSAYHDGRALMLIHEYAQRSSTRLQ